MELAKRKCENCGTVYQPRTRTQRFCLPSCRWQAWNKRNPRTRKENNGTRKENNGHSGATKGVEKDNAGVRR